jgi:hypothetical protein
MENRKQETENTKPVMPVLQFSISGFPFFILPSSVGLSVHWPPVPGMSEAAGMLGLR